MSAEDSAPPLSTSISAQQIAAQAVDAGNKGFGSPTMASPAVKQQLDFDLGGTVKQEAPGTPSTPAVTPAPVHGLASVLVKDEEIDIDYAQFVTDVVQWTNVVRSAFYLLGGTALILLVDYLVERNVPLITVVCYMTLAQMALNFVRHVVSPSMQQKATWLDSAWTHAAITSAGNSVKTLAALHDQHLSAASPHKHLLIAVALWIMALACSWISPTHLALAVYIGGFVVPKLYVMNRNAIEPQAKQLFRSVRTKFDAADRRIKAAVIMVLILALGLISTANFIIAVFVICLFATSQLPKEVEDLSKRASSVLTPIGNAAANAGGRIGQVVNTAVQKYELTPTPMKKKKM